MPDSQDFRVCLDKQVPLDRLLEAADLAIQENPENKSDQSIHPPVGVPKETFGAMLTGKKWKDGRTLRVQHLGGEAAVRGKVEQYVKEWERHANIRFQFVAGGAADVRISYHLDNRSWSYLGTDALTIEDDKETMHYGWLTPTSAETEFSRVILHEFGHALAMIHEHQHPEANIQWDEPVVVRFYQERVGWSEAQVRSNWFGKFDKRDTQFAKYDEKSIMHYFIPKEFTKDKREVGTNSTLSETDKQFIAQMYPNKP